MNLYSSNPCSRVSCIFTTVFLCFETVVLQNKTSNWEPSLLCSSNNNKTSLIPPSSTWLFPISLSDWALWLYHLQLRGFYHHSLTFIRVHHSCYNSIILWNRCVFIKKPFKSVTLWSPASVSVFFEFIYVCWRWDSEGQ